MESLEGDIIINRVANSSLITIDLKDFYNKGERVVYDLKENLFQGLVLKEKDFREFIKTFNWQSFDQKNVSIICSTDAIIPAWAYMLLITKIQPYANLVIQGSLEDLEREFFNKAFASYDFSKHKDEKIVIKGCSDLPIPLYAYSEITRLLLPYASSIMYGEPCSTVPVFKRSK